MIYLREEFLAFSPIKADLCLVSIKPPGSKPISIPFPESKEYLLLTPFQKQWICASILEKSILPTPVPEIGICFAFLFPFPEAMEFLSDSWCHVVATPIPAQSFHCVLGRSWEDAWLWPCIPVLEDQFLHACVTEGTLFRFLFAFSLSYDHQWNL